MSDFNFTTAAVAVTSHERKSARLESTYDGLVAHLSITVDTPSADVTDAARSIVIHGGAYDGTKTGATLTSEMLAGRDPGKAAHREYWKAARAVRIGLVSAAKRAAGESSTDPAVTDYLAAIIKAADKAVDHEIDKGAIADAMQVWLASNA